MAPRAARRHTPPSEENTNINLQLTFSSTTFFPVCSLACCFGDFFSHVCHFCLCAAIAMADRDQRLAPDLEREVTCFICTDILYQPLTLLDCLHTFCGSCLKEWFSWQALQSTSSHPYTCPSCRATVRGTRPEDR